MVRDSKRLFVGNLPPNTSDGDLRNEFSAYGRVLAVDVKTKEGNASGDKSNTFAFVNIELDDYGVRNCIQEFKEAAYKGFYLTVSVAKESFLDKLKREREEAAQNQSQKQDSKRPKIQEQEESEEFVIKPSKFKAEPIHRQIVEEEDEDDSVFKRRSKGAYFEDGKVKILGGTGTRLHATEPMHTGDGQPSGVAAESNQKRLQSLQKLRQAHDQQRFAIQNALKNSDNRKNNKIVFDTDEGTAGPGQARANLFNDEGDEEDFANDFASKKQFEGDRGQKLLELKTKFRNDDRFRMDEDFYEEEDVAAVGVNTDQLTEQQGERQRQLEILGSVVGRSFDSRGKKKGNLPATMLRFDPSKATHQKFYKVAEETEDGQGRGDAAEDVDMPKVSSDQFYKVSHTIGDSMKGESQGFSLLKMMGHDNGTGGGYGDGGFHDRYHAQPIEQRQKKNQQYEDNPFKYDSSDDESGVKKKRPTGAPSKDHKQPGKALKVGGKTNKRGIFRENFFILPGDARLEQGLAFYAVGPRDKTRNFQEIKKQLKKVVNQKVRKTKLMQKANSGRKVFKKK